MTLNITADFRIHFKTTKIKKLRKQNQCPATIYKNTQYPALHIALNYNDIQNPKIVKKLYINNTIKLTIDHKKTILVKIQDIQYHPIKSKITHIDFIRVTP